MKQSMDVNFYAHQYCASESVRIMKEQAYGGCLLLYPESVILFMDLITQVMYLKLL